MAAMVGILAIKSGCAGNETVFSRRDVRVVVVKRRQRANDTAHDRHRVGVAAETAEEVVDLVMDHGLWWVMVLSNKASFDRRDGSSPCSSR